MPAPRAMPLAFPGAALALAAGLLLAPPAQARVGQPLADAVAAARAAKVPVATFGVRAGVVVLEIWRAYPGRTMHGAPSWPRAEADRLARLLAGPGAVLRSDRVEAVSWATFPVPVARYADGTAILRVAKPDAPRVPLLVAGGRWALTAPFREVEAGVEGWVLARGKLTRRPALAM